MFLHFYKKFVYSLIENVQACKFARIKSAEFWDQIWIQYIHIVCLRVRQRIGGILTILAIIMQVVLYIVLTRPWTE